MQITVDIPDTLARQFGGATDLSREIREALAVDGYLTGRLTRGQVGESLGLSYYETEQWLAKKGVRRTYDVPDLDDDRRTLDRILPLS